MPLQFPFSAIVGSHAGSDFDDMALALILTTISPDVGGVLIRGEKGTAKSTMVRSLAAVLPPIDVVAGDRFCSDPDDPHAVSPDGPFGDNPARETRPVRLVELPVGATEDRVLGSLHLERALSEGRTEYEPGLLARAHRGILYVDEVNLLHDHLVDLLLDAAAMGTSTVERDGISVEHAARFVLVGTMNPEEGELRPQLLDRFGLTVEVAAPRDPALRVEVVRRRMAYDADPAGFVADWEEAERSFTARIEKAQAALESVVLDDAALLKIAEVCAAFDVDGMRADLVTARAAIAHAAWRGGSGVDRADIRAAARLSLPHRRRRNPFDAPGIDEALLDQVLGEDDPEPEPTDDGPGSADTDQHPVVERAGTPAPENQSELHQGTDSSDVSASSTTVGAGPANDDSTTTTAGEPYRPKLFAVSGLGAGDQGRRSRAITSAGRRIGAQRLDGSGGAIHLVETIRAAAPHQAGRARGSRLVLRPEDLRIAVREGKEANLILFCVDASGSMAARARMQQVKAAVLSLLLDAYRRRDKVGLVTFRASAAVLALPATSSVEIAAARLDDLPAGGRTPLAEGLLSALETLRIEAVRDPRRRPLLVVVTDGRATYGADAVARSQAVARHIATRSIATLVIDCETGRFRMGLARDLAVDLGADYVRLGEVSAAALTDAVRHRVEGAA
ncbi:MAG: magnesium chelatase [Marmoricola sp.]|nr:magnesium chelatase [Marmoricola sp.]